MLTKAVAPFVMSRSTFPPRDAVCDNCPTWKTLQDGLVHESEIETPNGDTLRNYRVVSSPIIDGSGGISAAIEMVEDITERKRAREERLRLQDQLHQAQKMEAWVRLPEE